MPPRTYTSHWPSLPIVDESIFTHLLSSSADGSSVGKFSASLPLFIDAPTGTTLTRGQVRTFALSLAHGLRTYPHDTLCRGNTILIYSPNCLAWPIVLFGSVAAGLKCTLANSAYNTRELGFQYQDSGAQLVFTSEEGLPNVLQMFKDLGLTAAQAQNKIIVLHNGLEWAGGPSVPSDKHAIGFPSFAEFLTKGALNVEEKFDGELANETAYICYSSGTTGKPKGVETTHRNLTAMSDMILATMSTMTPGNDSLLGFLPLYHIYGAVNVLCVPLLSGCPVALMPRFEPVAFCANIERYKSTLVLLVPPVLVVLARHPAVDDYDLSSLWILSSGAAPLGAALVDQVRMRLLSKRNPNATRPLYVTQGYGLTETSPTTHALPEVDSMRKIGSIGLLYPNLECRLVIDGEGDGHIDAADGEPGELWIRGPSIMKGYLNKPDSTKEAITLDGWFKTGDIGTRDAEGFYYIIDRRKELIKYKGFQVPPAELESVLLKHPDVADAAVIGVESAKEATELPRAYIVHASPDDVKTESAKFAFSHKIQKWIQTEVARHKFLRGGVVIVDVIPKSGAGKILRKDLRVLAKQELMGRDPADDGMKAKL